MKELSHVRNESSDLKPKIRQKVSEAMKMYDENIQNIMENHQTLEEKLNNLINFMNYFETKFTFFGSLIEDNKRLEEKISFLECQLKMIDIDNRDKENFSIKEQLFKLQKDIEIKNNIIKDYEETLVKNHETIISNTTRVMSRRVKETVPEEVVMKLKNEITYLSNQIISLNKSKETIEKFYQVELKNFMQKNDEKNYRIEELHTIIRKMENDFMGKKETIFNLWVLEFKEFKENLITISDIKILIEKFKIEGEELNIHKDRVYTEELYLLRHEVKVKDESVDSLRKNFEMEKKHMNDLIEICRKNVDSKVNAYENLILQKKNEVHALRNEKERLEGMEDAKRTVKLNFLFIFILAN
jgi:hypothetical protein